MNPNNLPPSSKLIKMILHQIHLVKNLAIKTNNRDKYAKLKTLEVVLQRDKPSGKSIIKAQLAVLFTYTSILFSMKSSMEQKVVTESVAGDVIDLGVIDVGVEQNLTIANSLGYSLSALSPTSMYNAIVGGLKAFGDKSITTALGTTGKELAKGAIGAYASLASWIAVNLSLSPLVSYIIAAFIVFLIYKYIVSTITELVKKLGKGTAKAIYATIVYILKGAFDIIKKIFVGVKNLVKKYKNKN